MRVSYIYPPNWHLIRKAFPSAGRQRGILFCYGDTIYNPDAVSITPDLFHHESVHSRQQGDDPAGWWDRYIEDPAFRLEMELEAYRAQLDMIRSLYGRGQSREMGRRIEMALASPLYGGMVSRAQARKLLAA